MVVVLLEVHVASKPTSEILAAVSPETPKQVNGAYSSAPMSGVVVERVSPSMSVNVPTEVPVLLATVPCTCKSVAELYKGSPYAELASCDVAVCHAANVVAAELLYLNGLVPVAL